MDGFNTDVAAISADSDNTPGCVKSCVTFGNDAITEWGEGRVADMERNTG